VHARAVGLAVDPADGRGHGQPAAVGEVAFRQQQAAGAQPSLQLAALVRRKLRNQVDDVGEDGVRINSSYGHEIAIR
jgi:hypothetical protein